MGIGKDKAAGGRAAKQEIGFLERGIHGLDPFAKEGRGQLSALDKVADAGLGQLGSLIEGSTAGGLNDRLAEILGGNQFGALRDERVNAAQGQLGAGGLTRSGFGAKGIADIGTDLALQLEQLLTGRSQGIFNQGLQTSQNLAGQGLGAAGGIANITGQQGAARSAGTLANATAQNAGIAQLGEFASKVFFASDNRLKDNIEKISTIGDLNLYEWDWSDKVKGTFIEDSPRIGFMAQEVEEIYPQHVEEIYGVKMIDYHGLKATLRKKFIH